LTRWQRVLNTIASLSTWPLLVGALLLALAPFIPEPHLWQKWKMLMDGSLARPIDIFDVFYHLLGFLFFGIRSIARQLVQRSPGDPST